jgi:U3 small nucleolar RNA-associated protein 7
LETDSFRSLFLQPSHTCLGQIPSELISLDPNAVVKVDSRAPAIKEAERKAAEEDNTEAFVPRHRKRGRSSTMRRYLRKQTNVIDGRREAIMERLAKEKAVKQADKGKCGILRHSLTSSKT